MTSMVQKITRTFAVFTSFMLVSILSFAQNASVKKVTMKSLVCPQERIP
jgi:hypothetical protein